MIGIAADDYRGRFEARTYEAADGAKLLYRLLQPKDYDPQTKYPLVLFLHGAGERGDDNVRQLVHGMNDFASDALRAKYPCFVVAPQCPKEQKWVDVNWSASTHDMPAQAAGPLRLVPGLDETFLVMNGDLLTTLDYGALVRFHREHGAVATIATHPRSVRIDYGVVEPAADGTLAGYVEKPEYHYRVSMGINVLEPRALDHIRPGETLGMPDLMLRLREAGHRVMTCELPCLWLDIGRMDDYEAALETFRARRAEFGNFFCRSGGTMHTDSTQQGDMAILHASLLHLSQQGRHQQVVWAGAGDIGEHDAYSVTWVGQLCEPRRAQRVG